MAAFLESGKKLKPLKTYEERLARLRDCDYVLSSRHQEQLWLMSSSTVDEAVLEFVRRFIDVAARHQIPVYCRRAAFDYVELVHAQFEDRLDDADWIIFGQIGDEVCATSKVKARWSTIDGGEPFAWWVVPRQGVSPSAATHPYEAVETLFPSDD